MTTPNMGLTKPGVTGSVSPTAGPTYATQQNTDLDLLDAHDHTSGKGTQVPSAGININADLSYTGFGPINQSYSRYTPISAPGATINGGIFVVGKNLYYQNTSGVNVQLTSDNVVMSTGAGDYNGFYPFGGNGYAGIPAGTNAVQAGYDSTGSQYRFGNTNADPNTSGSTTFANVAIGTLYIAAAAHVTALTAGTVWNNSAKAATYGWALGITNSTGVGTATPDTTFKIAMDGGQSPLAAGDFTVWHPLKLSAMSSTNTGHFAAALSINSRKNGLTANATIPLLIGSAPYDASGGGFYTINQFEAYPAGGAPIIGGGLRTIYASGYLTGNSSYTSNIGLATIDAVWTTAPGVSGRGGLLIRGASGGSLTSVAGFQLANVSGADFVGIGGSWDTAGTYALKVNGSATVTGGTVVTGNSTFGGTLGVTGATSLAALTATTIAGTTVAGTTGTFSSTVTGTEFIPSSTGAFVGGTGGIWKNTQVLAWGNYDAAGNKIDGYNVTASVASITNTSMFNGTFGVNLTSSTSLVVVANVMAGTDASGAWTAQGQVTGAHTWSVCIYKNNTLTLPVVGFSFLVLGTP